MTYEDYLSHYFNTRDMILFLLIALAGAFVFTLLLILVGRLTSVGNTPYKRKLNTYYHTYNLVQRFYEMVFSASSILSFLALYYLVDRFVLFDEFRIFWDKYSDLAIKNIIILFKWIYLYIPALKSVISCELLLFCSLFSMFGECSVFCVFCESADVE